MFLKSDYMKNSLNILKNLYGSDSELLNIVKPSDQHSEVIITKYQDISLLNQFFNTELPLDKQLWIIDSEPTELKDKWILDGQMYQEDLYEMTYKEDAFFTYSDKFINSHRKTPKFYNTYNWGANNYGLTQKNLTWLIENIPAGDIIYLHNVESLFSFYDKGGKGENGKRFINFVMRIIDEDKSHIWVLNTDVDKLRSMYKEGIHKFHKPNEYSLNIMKAFLNTHQLVSYNDYDEKYFYGRIFNTQWDLKSFISDYAITNYNKAESQMMRLLHLVDINTVEELMYIYDNEIHKEINTNSQYRKGKVESIYGFGNTHRLADQIGLPRRFMVKMMFCYIKGIELDTVDFRNEQMHVYHDAYTMSMCHRNATSKKSNAWNYEADMFDEHFDEKVTEVTTKGDVKVLQMLHEGKINKKNPITIDLLNDQGINFAHVNFRRYLLKNVFGYDQIIPDYLVECIISSRCKSASWNDLWYFQSGLDGRTSKELAEMELDRLMIIMSTTGIFSLHKNSVRKPDYQTLSTFEYNEMSADDNIRQLAYIDRQLQAI